MLLALANWIAADVRTFNVFGYITLRSVLATMTALVISFVVGPRMGVLPTKGLTLPLLSFGGSGIVANCVALAVLLRVDYENRRLLRGFTV